MAGLLSVHDRRVWRIPGHHCTQEALRDEVVTEPQRPWGPTVIPAINGIQGTLLNDHWPESPGIWW